ncbi:MAG TPA: peptidoglycan-binding domain-containing protein, partial [Candidatus Pacearchaeota archaeon]|nr:peptidoglycan-binding domain-containing protein [Candidatus Pacearchaeota archaeon]
MSKKLLGLIAGLAIALSVMVVPVVHGEDAINLDDMSNEQLIAYIQSLLQGSSTTTTTTPTETTTPTTGSSNWVSLGIPAGFQFSKNLSQGMTGNDVKYLQIVLNSDSATAVATTGVGSKGNESSYFGGLTKTAVAKFQTKYASSVLTPLGLTQGTGFVGTTTRAKLNELLTQGGTTTPTDVSSLTAVQCVTQGYAWNGTVCSDPKAGQIDVSSLSALDCVTKGYAWNGTKCYDPKAGTTTPTTPVVTPVTGAGLVVALSSDSPVNSTLITGQSAAPIAKFVITNKDSVEAKVTKVELQRVGVSGDTTLANVYLFDGTTRLTDAATISQGKITFNNPYGVVTIPAGNSVIVTVASDIATGTAGQTAGVALIGLTSNVEVKSTLPITGGTQTIASADLAEVTVGTVSNPSGSVSVNAGATGYTVFQAPITVTKREVELKGATFKVIGSIPTDALENIKLYYNGILVSDAVTLASDSTARFVLSTPKKIQSGNLEVRADVVKGSSRNFSFSLQNASDLVVVDSVYNVNAVVKGTPKTAGTVNISQGSVSITQDSTFNKTSVTGGVSNITLAKFNFKAYGEDVKISQLGVNPTLT